MRREERHHLKENPLAVVLSEIRGWMTEQGRYVVVGGAIVVIALIAAGGYFTWTQVQTQRAGELLAEAMSMISAPVVTPEAPGAVTPPAERGEQPDASAPSGAGESPETSEAETDEEVGGESETPATSGNEEPVEGAPTGDGYASLEAKYEAALPKLLAVVGQYPRTQQAVVAEYEAAAALVRLGRTDEAATRYSAVIDRAGDSLYGQMAVMGLAEAYLGRGQSDEAIALLKERVAAVESLVPVDAVLMRLGRAYEIAERPHDALTAFSRIVHEFPISVYSAEAQDAVIALEQSGAAVPASGDE